MNFIIDEQGRIFGKINIIDLLALIFVLSLAPMFYFGYRIFNKPPPNIISSINWEQKYNEEVMSCEKRHNEEIAKREAFCKEHKRAGICK